jgi:uncharacterized protein (DUF983 family)
MCGWGISKSEFPSEIQNLFCHKRLATAADTRYGQGVRITFLCPKCKTELTFDDLSQDQSPCPACGQAVALHISPEMRQLNIVNHCAICNCPKVYVQKDFNRTLGIGILIVGCTIALVLLGFDRLVEALAVLIGFSAADALLYKLWPDATICYRCHAVYRDFARNPKAEGFELGLAEKFDPVDKTAKENPAADWKQR